MDVNVHPTKQEIKFEDEKIVYAFVQAAVKHALAQFSVTLPSIFDLDPGIQQLSSVQQPFTEDRQIARDFGIHLPGFTQKTRAHFIEPDRPVELRHWKILPGASTCRQGFKTGIEENKLVSPVEEDAALSQLLNTYIIAPSARDLY